VTDDSFASFFSHPLGVALIAAVAAAITARLTVVKAMLAQGLLAPPLAGPGPSVEERAPIAAIAAAVAASFGASRIFHIGIVPSGPVRETQFPALPEP
jgi:hypothetical protein